jgi:hypothetical protein
LGKKDRGSFNQKAGLFTAPRFFPSESVQKMKLDDDKIDRAVLALLYLGLHDGARAWKGFDWDALNRLHEQGFISNPRGKAKSVLFTEEGLVEARRLLKELFSVKP